MKLMINGKKAKNVVLGILSCIIIVFVVFGIIAIGNRKSDEKGTLQSQPTTTQSATVTQSVTTTQSVTVTQSVTTTQPATVTQSVTTTLPATVTQPDATTQSAAITQPVTTTQSITSSRTLNAETIDEKVNRILAGMTLEEKVYQMFIVTPEALVGKSNVTQAGQIARESIDKYPVGGIICFSNNIVNESQITAMLSEIQKYSADRTGLKMFTCIDEEGGRVARIGNNSAFNVETFPDMAYISGEKQAYHVGDTIGAYLSEYGFNVDFAPDADVITNSENQVIGTRSFGTDPGVVSSMALSVAKGLNSHGVLAVYKHFPGHGATVGDTHEGFAYTDKTLEELMGSELIPFKSAADNGIDMVMAAHISVPNVIGDNTPCSLSYKMITGILREKLGYRGLIITDALNMGAIANNYSSDTAAIMAVKAGNDLLLMPKDFKAAAEAVIREVRNGNISEERINESVRKIIRAKYAFR